MSDASGSWGCGSLLWSRLVHAAVGGSDKRIPYYGKRDGANCDSSGSVGKGMGRKESAR